MDYKKVNMFDGFKLETQKFNNINIRYRIGGKGYPLLLLHGNPQTHVMWHKVAAKLSKHFTIVASDLTGYGGSGKPSTDENFTNFTKRDMASVKVEMMRKLGFQDFFVCGHDRGGRVAYRMALDHSQIIKKIAVLDIIPTFDAFNLSNKEFSSGYYHWFFLSQPSPLPEKLINANPDFFWKWHTNRIKEKFFDEEALNDYLKYFRNEETVRCICDDYRAALNVDYFHDKEDKFKNKIKCPLLVLWGKKAKIEEWYDPIKIWQDWAENVTGDSIDCGHYLPEEKPDETCNHLLNFFL